MTSTRYDLGNPPPAEEWLAADEAERVAAVEEAHREARAAVGQNPTAHASIHVVVEDRIAARDPAVTAAYERCRGAGLDRHTTIHALGSVVTRHMVAVLEQGRGPDQATADADFAAIDPAKWMRKR